MRETRLSGLEGGVALIPPSLPLSAHQLGPHPELQSGLTCCGGCWHLVAVMSITLQLDLPELVAAEAKAKGLLDPKNVATLIARELAAEADPRSFFEIVREIRAQPPGEAMTMEEIQAEVDLTRAERRAREAGR
jgi:hypothetical protein